MKKSAHCRHRDMGQGTSYTLQLDEMIRGRWTCRNNGLPHKISKRSGYSAVEKASPFVEFVWELQACLPRQYQLTRQSKGALASAMNRAMKIKINGVTYRQYLNLNFLDQFNPKTFPKTGPEEVITWVTWY